MRFESAERSWARSLWRAKSESRRDEAAPHLKLLTLCSRLHRQLQCPVSLCSPLSLSLSLLAKRAALKEDIATLGTTHEDCVQRSQRPSCATGNPSSNNNNKRNHSSFAARYVAVQVQSPLCHQHQHHHELHYHQCRGAAPNCSKVSKTAFSVGAVMIFGQAKETERKTTGERSDSRETFKQRENLSKLTLHCSGRVGRLADWQIVREEPQSEREWESAVPSWINCWQRSS